MSREVNRAGGSCRARKSRRTSDRRLLDLRHGGRRYWIPLVLKAAAVLRCVPRRAARRRDMEHKVLAPCKRAWGRWRPGFHGWAQLRRRRRKFIQKEDVVPAAADPGSSRWPRRARC